MVGKCHSGHTGGVDVAADKVVVLPVEGDPWRAVEASSYATPVEFDYVGVCASSVDMPE